MKTIEDLNIRKTRRPMTPEDYRALSREYTQRPLPVGNFTPLEGRRPRRPYYGLLGNENAAGRQQEVGQGPKARRIAEGLSLMFQEDTE